jgi:hypothetical protein
MKAKWVGDLAQGVEHLPGKCKTLSSNPIPPTNKQKTANFYCAFKKQRNI